MLLEQTIFFYFGILKLCSSTKRNSMKVNARKYLLLRPLFSAVMGTVLSVVVISSCKSPEAPAPKNQVERLASSINFKCPFMVDEDTRMDSVNILPDSTFQYNYTLVNQDKNKLDIHGLTNYIGPRLQQTMRTSSNMAVQRAHKLRMVFHYRDRNGEVVMEIILEPEDYL